MKYTQHVFTLLALLSISACFPIRGLGGSDVGNPDVKSDTPVSADLAKQSCDTLNFCYSGFDRQACRSESIRVSGVAPFLGLRGGDSLESIEVALDEKRAELNTARFRTCLEHLQTLRCSDLALDEIWNSRNPSDYRGMRKFWSKVQNVCGDVIRSLD